MNDVSLAAKTNLPSFARALKALARLEEEVDRAETFLDLDRISDVAAGLQRMFRPLPEAANRAGVVVVKAETKVGAARAAMPKATGAAGPGRGKAGSKAGRAFTDAPTLAELGLDKKRASRAQKLAMVSAEQQSAIFQRLAGEGKPIAPNTVLAAIRQDNKRDKVHAVATAAFSSEGPFGTVVIDPPWPVQKIDRDVRLNQDAFDYPTMTEAEIETFWKAEVASRLEDDCHLFMWTTQKFLPTTFDLIERLSFRYVLTMVWHKPGGFQPIDLPQYNCEFTIYARRGSPVFVDTKNFDCCFSAPRREHSRKPDAFYDVIRRVTGGSRIDVFSREAREGFAQYGNETAKFAEAAQ
jgi:N6-adenosine-specific RNA methylase IME4